MKYLVPSLVVYALMLIVCFGPATADSEDAMIKHRETCAPQPACKAYGPSVVDGLYKAIFWPFWLSYKVARG